METDLRTKFLTAYPNAHAADYDAMVQDEAENEMREFKRRSTARNWTNAYQVAQERIQRWADEAHEYAICRGGFTIASFVASHRRACVWAVLVGREAKGETLRGPAATLKSLLHEAGTREMSEDK